MIRGLYKRMMLGIMIILGTSSLGALNEVLTYEAEIIAHIRTGRELTNGIKVNVNSVVLDHLTVNAHSSLGMMGGTSREVEIKNAIKLTDGNGNGLPKGTQISFQIKGDDLKKGYLMAAGKNIKDLEKPNVIGLKNELRVTINGALEKQDDLTPKQLNLSYGVENTGSSVGGLATDDRSGILTCYSNGAEEPPIELDIKSGIQIPKLNEIIDAINATEDKLTEYTNDSKLIIKVATP